MSGFRANRLCAFRARAMPQFQVTMRRCAMFLSLADQSQRLSFQTVQPNRWTTQERSASTCTHDVPFFLAPDFYNRPSSEAVRNRMIEIQQFENIKHKHGSYASWAVWADASEKPKSNMGDVSHFKNEGVLSLLQNGVVMVGLNISRPVSEPFINFHDPNPRANDFKIRYAFKNSAYYGAYMTDIIKFLEEVYSKNVMKYLKERPEIVEQNLKTFREKMKDLKATAPIV